MATPLRDRWDSGEHTLGGWLAIPSSISAELMARAGFDWVCVDAQHGLADHAQTLAMIQAASIAETPVLVRVAWNDPGLIGRALDCGADGVIVPMVNSPEQAARAVAACRYPPDGERSWGPIRQGLMVDGLTPERGNRHAACAIMIETRQAVQDIDRILSVSGIDAVYLGPMDLSVSYGLPPGGLISSAQGDAIFTTIVESCRRHNVMPGTHCPDVDGARRFRELGFRMLNVAGDARFLRLGAESIVAALGKSSTSSSAAGYA